MTIETMFTFSLSLALGIGGGLALGFFLIMLLCHIAETAFVKPEATEEPEIEEPEIVERQFITTWVYERNPSKASKPEKVQINKPWSKDYDSCLGCGTTDRPCHGHGLCQRCYNRQDPRKR